MCCNKSNWLMGMGALLGLVVLGTAVWYLLQPEWRKQQINSLARQVPEMPGRYMV